MRWRNIEQEARNFNKLRTVRGSKSAKPLTTRRYLAGQAMSGLIARGKNNEHMKDVVREAYEWADSVLEED